MYVNVALCIFHAVHYAELNAKSSTYTQVVANAYISAAVSPDYAHFAAACITTKPND